MHSHIPEFYVMLVSITAGKEASMFCILLNPLRLFGLVEGSNNARAPS